MTRVPSVFVLALALGVSPAFAQTAYPAKPIRMIVPLAAGGGIDLIARTYAGRMSDQMGQNVLVENQGGGGGTVAAAQVARAAPDGYTLIFPSLSAAVQAAVLKNLPYDPVKDFTPVSLAARFPLVLIVNTDVPARDLKQFIQLLRNNPGRYNYGSSGTGTATHLAGEWFKSLAKVDMVHVPYKGNSAVLPDLMAGRVAALFDGLPPQTQNIKAGKVRALAVTTTTRAGTFPELPAMTELVPGYDMPFWAGIFAPARTPRPVVERLAAEAGKAAKHPATVEKLKELGTEAVGSSPASFESFWQQQVALYARLVKEANIKLDQE